MFTILFMPTMRCNLRCSYCHFKHGQNGFEAYGKFHEISSELNWQDWLQYFNRWRPYFLEFTGGEPLMWKGFKNFIAHIPARCSWAITSNTLLDVTSIPSKKCKSWTASYHYEAKEKFEKNMEILKARGFPVSVSVVAKFGNIKDCIAEAFYFSSLGYRVNILRELNPNINWEGTEQWRQIVALRAKGFNVVEDDIPPKYDFPKGFVCLAGKNYVCAMPDGKIYRCYSQAMLGEPMGNIENVELLNKASECDCPCLGCAKDFQSPKKKLNKNDKDTKVINRITGIFKTSLDRFYNRLTKV